MSKTNKTEIAALLQAVEEQDTLRGQLIERNRQRELANNEMWEMLSKVTAVLEEKIFAEAPFAGASIEWRDIFLRNDITDAFYLELTISFPVGATINVDNDEIFTVTEENKGHLDRDVLIALPFGCEKLKSKKKVRKALALASKKAGNADDLGKFLGDEVATTRDPSNPLSDQEMKKILLQARNPGGIKH